MKPYFSELVLYWRDRFPVLSPVLMDNEGEEDIPG